MNKLINTNEYLKLSTYAVKYGTCVRKLYRYRHDNQVNYIIVDGIFFIKDEPSIILKNNNTRNNGINVTTVTLDDENVTTVTPNKDNYTDNQEVNKVTTVTIGDVTTVTLDENDDVTIVTLKKRLSELYSIPENDRKIKDFEEIKEIEKKITLLLVEGQQF